MSDLSSTLVLRRYSNRKLYNVADSRYVSGDVVLEAVRQGRNVSVIDHKTGRDITAETVLSALAFQFREGPSTQVSKEAVFQAVTSLTTVTNN